MKIKIIIFITLLLVTVVMCYSTDNSTLHKETEIVKYNHNVYNKVLCLEKEQNKMQTQLSKYDAERALWGNTLEKTNIYFAAFNGLILLLIGLGYFGFFRHTTSKIRAEAELRFKELKIMNIDNQSLVFRSMYFNCIAMHLHWSAILWATRFLLSEVENLTIRETRNNMLKVFISNVHDVCLEADIKSLELDTETRLEIVTNTRKFIQLYGSHLDEASTNKLIELNKMVIS